MKAAFIVNAIAECWTSKEENGCKMKNEKSVLNLCEKIT
jgi:hypothetical protein